MTRTLNLTGFLTGDNLTLSVSQGALTAGPVNVPSWGGLVSDQDISIDIVSRSTTQIAPESILFGVDFSAANFDTQGPSVGEIYDPRMHDLIYLWTFDDPGTWSKPQNVLSHWRNSNEARSPFPAHLFRNDGTFTVSVTVIEPSSGKVGIATRDVTTYTPESFYADADTIYINPEGDGDFSDVPAGVPSGNKINANSLKKVLNGESFEEDANWANFEGGNAKRWRFKRGGTYQVSVYLNNNDTEHVMFDDYGNPEDPEPIWTRPSGTLAYEEYKLRAGYNHGDAGSDTPEIRVRNIKMLGTHDPTTVKLSVSDPGWITDSLFNANQAIYAVFTNCDIDGLSARIFQVQHSSNPLSSRRILHVDDAAITNWGGFYPFLINTGTETTSYFALTGVSAVNPADAFADQTGSALIRHNSGHFHYIKCLEVFSTEFQKQIEINKTVLEDGAIGFVEGVYQEGSDGAFSYHGNHTASPESRSYAANYVLDGAIIVGTWMMREAISTTATGLTVRNVYHYQAGMGRSGNPSYGMMGISEESDVTDGANAALPAAVSSAPIKVYNSTYRMDRTSAQHAAGFPSPVIEGYFSEYPSLDVTFANNVVHQPNLDAPYTDVADGPLVETTLFTAYCTLGRRNKDTGVLDTSLVVPNGGAIPISRPDTGSPALTDIDTNAPIAYHGIGDFVTKRGTPPYRGVWDRA